MAKITWETFSSYKCVKPPEVLSGTKLNKVLCPIDIFQFAMTGLSYKIHLSKRVLKCFLRPNNRRTFNPRNKIWFWWWWCQIKLLQAQNRIYSSAHIKLFVFFHFLTTYSTLLSYKAQSPQKREKTPEVPETPHLSPGSYSVTYLHDCVTCNVHLTAGTISTGNFSPKMLSVVNPDDPIK